MAKGLALVIGASGGIGAAVFRQITEGAQFEYVWGTSRSSGVAHLRHLNLTDEASIEAIAAQVREDDEDLRLVFDATGYLHGSQGNPEKSWSQLDANALANQFAINTIGPALLLKHFLPLLPRHGRAVFATLSAKVGSISDNRLGGWYGYRAAKAGLNQIIKTASVELARKRPDAICVGLHPGTVATELSKPFAKSNLRIQQPHESASAMLSALEKLTPEDSGHLISYDGTVVPF